MKRHSLTRANLASPRVIGDRFVYRTRVTEVVCADQDQHGLAAKLAEIRDAQLAAGNIRRSSSSRAGIGLSAAV